MRSKLSIGSMLGLVISLIFVVSMISSSTEAGWDPCTLDHDGNWGEASSIALDSNGKVHISHIGITGEGQPFFEGLRYTTNASGSWESEQIDQCSHSYAYTSIAVDSNNKVHISYHCTKELEASQKYATNASGSWVTETVPMGPGILGRMNNSIALDSNDKVHISSFHYGAKDLMYATNANGSWSVDRLDKTGHVGLHNSIAVDENDKIHISYYDGTNGKLKYATDASGSWVTTQVAQAIGMNTSTSIALDSAGRVHIAYEDSSPIDGALKYATNASGTWIVESVDQGKYPSIALDGNDKAHICHNGEGLVYVTNASGAWIRTQVDETYQTPAFTSIALDSSGKVHISYHDQYINNLKYATQDTGCHDGDGDRFGDPTDPLCTCPLLDCDDSNPEIYPWAKEKCNGIDDACNGSVPDDEADSDTDGYRICDGDCDDSNPDVNPGMPEMEGNGIDDDCDPSTPGYLKPANTLAAANGPSSLIGSGILNGLVLVFVPVGALFFLRRLHRIRLIDLSDRPRSHASTAHREFQQLLRSVAEVIFGGP